MINIRKHYICIDPYLLKHNWDRYKTAYKNIEDDIPRYSEIPNFFVYQTHTLGGFYLPKRKSESFLQDYFQRSERKFILSHRNKFYSRGLAYYPGLQKDLDEYDKLVDILKVLSEIVSHFDREHDRYKVNSAYAAMAQDYIRNYLLIIYHAFKILVSHKKLLTSEHDSYLDQLNNQIKSCILKNEISLFTYITNDESSADIPKNEILNIKEKLSIFFKKHEMYIRNDLQGKKLVREVREMDSLWHIYSFSNQIANKRTSANTLMLGLEYGGIELPFAINAVRILKDKQKLFETTIHVSHYSNNTLSAKRLQDIVPFQSEKEIVEKKPFIWLLDDSITTGRSIDKITKLLDEGAVVYLGVVSFKVSNRYHHLIMEEHGGLNPVIAKHSSILCQASYSSTYKANSYLGRSGVFDVNKYKLYRLLGRDAA